jgi:putative hydrolase of the HAD superfamily
MLADGNFFISMPRIRQNRQIPDVKNVSTIVFDVGDTLFGTTSLMESALQWTAAIMKRKGLIENSARFCRTYLDTERLVVGPAVNHLFSGLEILELVWSALGLKASPASLGTFLSIYRDFVRRGIRRDGRLIATFKRLRHSGFRLAVLTDGSTEEQLEQLVRLGIVEQFELVVTSQQVGVEKPGRQMFDFLLSSLSIKASESLMVGNDIERDILGAKAAGMSTALVTFYSRHQKTQSLVPADFVIKDISSLLEVLLDRQDGR